jgi:predicted ABC-type ATPase
VPVLTVVAGPNGSGKSSILRILQFEGKENLLDTDAIAKEMNPSDPYQAALAAGREVIRRERDFIERGESFAIETTLSGSRNIATMKSAIQRQFTVRLVFICLDGPERNIRRVRDRVAKGGHFVPDDDVRRRYDRSLDNLLIALRLVNEAEVYDNSGGVHNKVLEIKSGTIIWQSPNQPLWTKPLLATLA